ncbi:MAG: nucleotidyltransferase domain-containing protein [Thermoplasmatales archaeon]|nr:nucleotidyltransferase domain-containing protein [Thermoplasmatales archaeon]
MMRVPLQNTNMDDVFKWKDARSLLLLLSRAPYQRFTVTELIDKLNIKSRDSLTKLVDTLEKAKMIKTTRIGRKRLISINRDLIEKPEDATLLIPQDEYRMVVKEYVQELKSKTKKDNLHAVILFGSVAMGVADRASDIDIFIASDKPLKTERTALNIAKKYLGKEPGRERYSIKPMAESISTLSKIIKNKPGQMAEILKQGITLYSDKKFEKFMEGVKI